MATRKGPQGQALRKIKSDLAKLKKAGLYSGDVRGAKGGWRQKALIKQYRDVIDGKAKAVKVGAKAAKQFDKTYKPKGSRVIVKTRGDGETFRVNKKGEIIGSEVDEYGVRYRRLVLPKGLNEFQNLPVAPKGKVYEYLMPDGFKYDREGAQKFLYEYTVKKHKRGIGNTVVIFEYNASDKPHLVESEQ